MQRTTATVLTSNLYGPELLDLRSEAHMSTDSTFQYEAPGQAPLPGTDEPSLDPENPDNLDPMRRGPGEERPEDRDPPVEGVPAADDETPLSDDLR